MRLRLGTWSRYLFYLKQQSYSVSRYAHAVTSLNSRASNHIPIIVPFRRLADWKDSHGKGSEGTVSKGFKRFSSQMESDVNVFIDAVNEENSPNYDKYEAYKTDVERYEFETKTVAQVQDAYERHISREPNTPNNSRILRVAIIGATNSGKSTLINTLIGWKVNGVSVKINTTEENAASVLTKDNTQIVIIDTPGVMKSEARVRFGVPVLIEQEIEESVKDADMIGVIFDCGSKRTKFHQNVLKILHENSHKPSFLVLNKVDLLKNLMDTLPICGHLTDGIVGGQVFGVGDLEKSREKLGRGRYREIQEFEKKLEELEGKYGKLDCLSIKDSNDDESLEQVQGHVTVQDTRQEKTEETVPKTQLEEDSYQKDFLEGILLSNDRGTNSKGEPTKTRENVSSGPTGKSWVERLEKAKEQIDEYGSYPFWSNFDAVFPVSALKGDGIGYLLEFLFKNAKPGPWLYHSSIVTCQSPAQIAIMCVRQALLEHVELYLPYVVDINILYWNLTNYGRLEIVMELLVKNRYEMGLILKNQPKGQSLPSRMMLEHVKFIRHGLNDDFRTKSWRIVQIANDAKQALLDAFQCEIKFKLGVRLDKSVKRKVDTGRTKLLLKRSQRVQKHGTLI